MSSGGTNKNIGMKLVNLSYIPILKNHYSLSLSYTENSGIFI